jgi:hypothetical protein
MRRNKHGNVITEVDGIKFDSKLEARRWQQLKALEGIGQIGNLCRQVKYVLIPAQRIDGKLVEHECSYKADFCYYRKGELVVEDVKGYRRGASYNVFVIKRKLMLEKHGIQIKEITEKDMWK